MMLDDKSLLSAYLDDELDPAGRLEVESALLTDPRLSEELHELAGVRELLAGLPRPGLSRDLADEVGARLGRRRAPWPSRWAFPPALAAPESSKLGSADGRQEARTRLAPKSSETP